MKAIQLKSNSFWGFISLWFSGRLQQTTCSLGWWAIYGFLTFPLWIFPLGIVNLFIRRREWFIPIIVSITLNLTALLMGFGISEENKITNIFAMLAIGWGVIALALLTTVIIMLVAGGTGSLLEKRKYKSSPSHPSFIKEFLKGQKEKHCSKIEWK